MTDENTEPEGHEPDEATPEPVDDSVKSGNAEAAKYRRLLREAETERDRLAEQVSVMHRGEVERLAADKLRDPGDLWLADLDVSALLCDNGAPDQGKVDAAIAQVLDAHPGWAATRRPNPDPSQGRPSAPSEGGQTWAGALRGEG